MKKHFLTILMAMAVTLTAFTQDNTTMEILQGSEALLWDALEEVTSENQIAVYPNPATDLVNIESEYTMESITIYNFAGQVVLTEAGNSNTYRVNTSNLDAGIYLFQIETEEGRIAKRIVIE